MRASLTSVPWSAWRTRGGFTLVELLVCMLTIGLLAGLMLPGLAQAKKQALRASCLGQLRQQGLAWQIYLDDHANRFPDRRDLKAALPGGYKPWESWPKSDPRSGWAAVVLREAGGTGGAWRCPAAERSGLARAAQVSQVVHASSNAWTANYWMWRFDRLEDPVPGDNFWGTTPEQAVLSLHASGNPTVGTIGSVADVELTVDAYFPQTAPGVEEAWRGRSAHRGGRNRLFLDGRAEFWKDARTARE